MMRDKLRLRVGPGPQRLRRAAMQRLAAALQQTLVGGVLDEGVFERFLAVEGG
jgi:hypothetical protein